MKKVLGKIDYYLEETSGWGPSEGLYSKLVFEEGHQWVDSHGKRTYQKELDGLLEQESTKKEKHKTAYLEELKTLRKTYKHLSEGSFNRLPRVKFINNVLK